MIIIIKKEKKLIIINKFKNIFIIKKIIKFI